MPRVLAIATMVLVLASCGQEPTAPVEAKTESEPATGGVSDAHDRSAGSRSPQLLPSGFALPFEHHVRANRKEKLGGATKRRVVAEIKGVPLDQADEQVATSAAKNGYSRGDRVDRDDGFVVTYAAPDGTEVQTSFFNGEGVKFESQEATGIVHVTWIVRH